MRIKTVHIQNFRTLEDVTIDFDSITTFIGPNGAGKSTVLRALDWFLMENQETWSTRIAPLEMLNIRFQ
ncbi:AAA family ATPase [Corynebacterium casei]|uniref:AAA family ATPase n=1 Tax=Corynebacterium casei TaxID=160386 RepID=UPI003FD4959A